MIEASCLGRSGQLQEESAVGVVPAGQCCFVELFLADSGPLGNIGGSSFQPHPGICQGEDFSHIVFRARLEVGGSADDDCHFAFDAALRPVNKIDKRAPLHLFVSLGELSAYRRFSIITEMVGHGLESICGAVGRFEKDHGPLLGRERGEDPGAVPTFSWGEAFEAEPVRCKPGDRERREDCRGAGDDGDGDGFVVGAAHEPITGVRHCRHPSIRYHKHSQASAGRVEEFVCPLGFVVVMEGEDLRIRRHADASCEVEEPSRVFGGDQVRGFEHGAEPGRRVAGVADGSCREVDLSVSHSSTISHEHPLRHPCPYTRHVAEVKDGAKTGRELTDRESRAWERELRGRLGLTWSTLPVQVRLWGWIATVLTGLIAALTRFIGLNHPHQMVFDETYYVKAGYSLVTYGYERDWVGENADEIFVQGSDVAADIVGDYVVHPPLGKWLIGFGQAIFGTDNGFGWRFATALAGVLSVMILTRIALRLFRSVPLAFAAGFFMALDGVGIVLSRTGILDSLLAAFVLAAFWAVLKDRDWTRQRLAKRVAYGPVDQTGRPLAALGPIILFRPWLLTAGIFVGLGCGVKWSAVYALAVFGILVFAWDTGARKAIGVRRWFTSGVFTGGAPAFFNFIPIAIPTYLLGWISWFLDSRGHKRGWAERQRNIGEEVPFEGLGDTIAEFIAYHRQMWDFHTGLSSEHTYMSQPWDWIIQLRPVNFYWPPQEKIVQDCGAERCVQAISSIGNPAVWWLAAASLLIVLWYAIKKGDWRAWAILAGYGAMYLPWFNYIGRTIYQFYSVAFLPYVALALTFGLAWATETLGEPNLGALRRAARKRWQKEVSEDWTLALENAQDQDSQTSSSQRASHATAADHSSALTVSDNNAAETVPAEPCEGEPTGSTDADRSPEVSDEAHEPNNSRWSEAAPDTPESRGADVDAELSDSNSGAGTEPASDPIEQAVASFDGPEPLGYALVPDSKRTWALMGVTCGFVLVFAAFWWPLWTGMTIPYDFWRVHIWLPGWS